MLKGCEVMFTNSHENQNEMYCQIVDVKDYLVFGIYPLLPQKKVTVKFSIEGKEYFVSQEIMDVLPKHEEVLKIGNFIRVLVDPEYPERAYIHEFDYPEYDFFSGCK